MAFDFYTVLDRVLTDPDFAADVMKKAVAFRNSVKRSEEITTANGKDVLRENAEFLALFKINIDEREASLPDDPMAREATTTTTVTTYTTGACTLTTVTTTTTSAVTAPPVCLTLGG